MRALNSEMEISTNTCYRKQLEFEMWAHYDTGEVMVELKVFEEGRTSRIYQNTVSDIGEGQNRLEGRQIFNFLCRDHEFEVFPMKGGITVEIKDRENSRGHSSKNSVNIKLWQKKVGPSNHTLMMVHLLTEKLSLTTNNIQVNESDQWQAQPILHETSSYKFQANLCLKEHKIHTKLTMKDYNHSGKPKEFVTEFEDRKLPKQFKEAFQNLENIFEHLRLPQNYEVLKKGTIKIINEPKNANQLALLRKRARAKRHYTSEGGSRLLNSKQDPDKLYSKIQRKFSKDLEGFKKTLVDETAAKIKQIYRQLQKANEKKIIQPLPPLPTALDQEAILQREEQLRKQLEDKLGSELKKMKAQFDGMIGDTKKVLQKQIKEGDDYSRLRFEQALRKNNEKAQAPKPPERERRRSVALGKVDWNPIEVDPASSQFRKFQIELNNVVIYNGPWEWTQLFTRTIIPHGKTTILQFKVIRSVYHAIAIGISDRENIGEKSSLSLKNSIAYWGDRQLWQGHKIKEEGSGFQSGDTVIMKVDLVKGLIQWFVGDQMRAHHSSPILRDRSLHLMAYVEMYDQGDSLQFLSYKISD